ncbi:MAG TPA: alpha/beta hydrolase [Dehalococcoidia bacterium]
MGQGTPVLFIHGGFGGVESTLFPRASVFDGVLPREAFRSITYDRRNSSRSGYTTRPYVLEDLASDAAALLDHLAVERAVIVGDSLGGMVAQKFALRWPERVTGLLLCETAPRIVRSRPLVRAALAGSRLLPPRVVFGLFRRRVLNPPRYAPVGPEARESQAVREERWALYLQTLREMPQQDLYRYSAGLLRTYAAFFGRDLSRELGRLSTLPVHVLHGTADTVVPFTAGEWLQRCIPNARLHALEGLDHGLLYYEEARLLVRELVERMAADAAPRKHGWSPRATGD